jgi:hypothetical protein
VLVTCDVVEAGITVSARVAARDHQILLNLRRDRDSLQRLRVSPQVAVVILAAGNIAFAARGQAHVIQEPMVGPADYAAVAINVERIDDRRNLRSWSRQASSDDGSTRTIGTGLHDALRRSWNLGAT